MPMHSQRVVDIIKERSQSVEDRCFEYPSMIYSLVTDILVAEGEHRVSATNIQKKIDDKIHQAGNDLYQRQSSKS